MDGVVDPSGSVAGGLFAALLYRSCRVRRLERISILWASTCPGSHLFSFPFSLFQFQFHFPCFTVPTKRTSITLAMIGFAPLSRCLTINVLGL